MGDEREDVEGGGTEEDQRMRGGHGDSFVNGCEISTRL
jgi:hypothetical protein